MHYNTAAELLIRLAVHSFIFFGLASLIDRCTEVDARVRLWTWNAAALAVFGVSLLPLVENTALQCTLSGHSSLYLNRIFHGSLFFGQTQSWCMATLMTWIWGLGTFAYLGKLGLLALRTRYELRKRLPCQNPRLVAHLEHCRSALGVVHPVKLSIHPSFGSPVVVSGGELCLSKSVLALDDAQLRAVLGHELAHVSRRDHLKLPLLEIARCFIWFAPFLERFFSARHLCVEELCDRQGSRCSGSTQSMAAALVEIAGCVRQPRAMLAAFGCKGAELSCRVRRLVAPESLRFREMGRYFVLLAIGVGLVGVFQTYAPMITMDRSKNATCAKVK